MTKHANETDQKRIWQAPKLKRLGAIKDIAGPTGLGNQSPTQLRT